MSGIDATRFGEAVAGTLVCVGLMAIWIVVTGWSWAWVAGAFALAALALGVEGRRILWNWIAKRKLGPLFVGLPASVRAGEDARLTFRVAGVAGGTRINSARVRLVQQRGSEEWVLGEFPLSEGCVVSTREPLRVDFELPFDEELPSTSWAGRGENVNYWVEVEVSIPNWPDWFHAYSVRVRGKGSREPEPLAVKARAREQETNQQCPYCKDDFAGLPREALLECGSCHTILHAECVHELGRCTTTGCANSQRRRRRVRG